MKRKLLILFLIAPLFSLAQTDSTAIPDKKQGNTYSPIIEFTSIQKNDKSVDLKAKVNAKIAGTLTKMGGLKIEFFSGIDPDIKKLGETLTDKNGIAFLNFKGEQLTTDAEGKLNFKVIFAGKDSIESAEEVLSLKRARLEITPVKEDSILSVKLKLVDLSTGTETAVPETALGVFVRRMFSSLKLGEGTTDESGETTVEIPNDLPGDAQGNLTLIAKLEENETYGNLEASVVQPWGTPVSYELKELPRALWSPHPPLWMQITFVVLMGTVWGHYLVIIIQLIRLRRAEPELE